jgi:hypothetical protein
MRIALALAMAILFCVSPAVAGPFADCKEAVNSNDRALAKAAVEEILSGKGLYVPPNNSDLVAECLLVAGSEGLEYSKSKGRFLPAGPADTDASKKRLEKKREAFDRLLLKQQSERRRLVFKRLFEACRNLYRSDPDRAITNQLCFEYFLDDGLPE